MKKILLGLAALILTIGIVKAQNYQLVNFNIPVVSSTTTVYSATAGPFDGKLIAMNFNLDSNAYVGVYVTNQNWHTANRAVILDTNLVAGLSVSNIADTIYLHREHIMVRANRNVTTHPTESNGWLKATALIQE